MTDPEQRRRMKRSLLAFLNKVKRNALEASPHKSDHTETASEETSFLSEFISYTENSNKEEFSHICNNIREIIIANKRRDANAQTGGCGALWPAPTD